MGDAERVFTIVSTHEVDPSKGKISDQSDMGAALMDQKVGKKISVKGREIKILEIKFD
jgi:transcription elongation GreA/GreB family factor